MSQRLSYPERCIIERMLNDGKNYAEIGKALNRDKSTIMREVKRNSVVVGVNPYNNTCINFQQCKQRYACDYGKSTSCFQLCKLCKRENCNEICEKFRSNQCDKLTKAPYVCNGCMNLRKCNMQHKYYISKKADSNSRIVMREAHKGVRVDKNKLDEINVLITPLIKQGQSLNHILSTHSIDIGLSEKTIYNYIDSGILDIRNIDLPKKVAYRKRRAKTKKHNAETLCRKGRTIEDFEQFVKQTNPKFVVEMDTVKGRRGSHKTLLTMIFRGTSFMLVFLMPDGTQESVQEVFDMLTKALGLNLFSILFNTILTDNGPEFKNPDALEFTERGHQRCNIFYCDPLASWQKPHIENNHKLLRRILPKGTSFDNLTQSDITLITNHINSVAREIYSNQTPFEMINKRYFKKPLERFCLEAVPPDSINLTPKLIKK